MGDSFHPSLEEWKRHTGLWFMEAVLPNNNRVRSSNTYEANCRAWYWEFLEWHKVKSIHRICVHTGESVRMPVPRSCQ